MLSSYSKIIKRSVIILYNMMYLPAMLALAQFLNATLI